MLSSISLANHRFKLPGLIISATGIVLFVILKILNYTYEEGWEQRIFIINLFVIVFGMVMIMYSSESNDDERVKPIRHSLRTNPSWIFRKSHDLKFRFIMMGAAMVFLIGWIVFVVINYKT